MDKFDTAAALERTRLVVLFFACCEAIVGGFLIHVEGLWELVGIALIMAAVLLWALGWFFPAVAWRIVKFVGKFD